VSKIGQKKSNAPGYAAAVLGLLIIAAGVTFIIRYQADMKRRAEAVKIDGYGPRAGVPKSIEDLKNAIAAYEKALKAQVDMAAQTGVYWKILGTRYRDKNMHIEAIEAFTHALQYSDEETLHYLLGLEAAQAGKSAYPQGGPEQQRYYAMAENAYLRALSLADNYTQARYAIASLYVFDLDRPSDAIPHLERYMEGRSGDAEAMFMMARACYMLGRDNEAVDWYKKGIPFEKDKARAAEAEANIRFIQGR